MTRPATNQARHDRNGYTRRRRPASGNFIGQGIPVMPPRAQIIPGAPQWPGIAV